MSRIKVILQNEQGQRLTCSGELFEKDDERHVTISQDENPSLKVPVVRLMLSPDTIVPAKGDCSVVTYRRPWYDARSPKPCHTSACRATRGSIRRSPDAPIHLYLAPEFLVFREPEIDIPNIVTAVLASYRGFDTLGEVIVVFTAGIGVLLLIGQHGVGRRTPDEEDEDDKDSLSQ